MRESERRVGRGVEQIALVLVGKEAGGGDDAGPLGWQALPRDGRPRGSDKETPGRILMDLEESPAWKS